MTATLLFLALAGWFAIGVVLSVLLGRRGHDRFTWFVLGALLGPLAVAFAVYSARREEQVEPEVLVAPTATADADAVDVLVGFDDLPGSRAVVESVVSLFGVRLGRLTLMTVVPFDGGRGNEEQARAALAQAADRLGWLAPGVQVGRGDPAATLAAAAAAGGYDLIAVGTTGAGRSLHFGSTAGHLATQGKVPVLITGQGTDAVPPGR